VLCTSYGLVSQFQLTHNVEWEGYSAAADIDEQPCTSMGDYKACPARPAGKGAAKTGMHLPTISSRNLGRP
jgi:hypothetical protein